MAISISYVDMESKQVGTISSPLPCRLIVDRVLRESHLSVEFGFTPPLPLVEASIADFRDQSNGGNPYVLHLYSKSPVAYRDATPIELELWSSF